MELADIKIKDRFVAALIAEDRLRRTNRQMKKMGDAPLESDIGNKQLESASSIVAAIAVPGIAPFLVNMLGAEIAGEALKKIVEMIAPSHTGVQETADIFGAVIGGLLTDPAAIELLVEKYGTGPITKLAEEIYKDPEQLELFKEIVKAPTDPGSEQAIQKFRQMEQVRLSKLLAERQEKELATRTKLPPEQLNAPLKHPRAPINISGSGPSQITPDFFVREFFQDTEPEQGELFNTEKPDFESYQGSTGKLIPDQEQLSLFTKFPEQLLLDLGEGLGAKGKKEAIKKIEKVVESRKWGATIFEAMYDAMLLSPVIPLTKVITDSLFLPVQVVFRALGTAGEHGAIAGGNIVMAAMHAYKESFSEALRWGWVSIKEDRPAFQEMLGMAKEEIQAFAGADTTGDLQFANSPFGLAMRWLHAGFSSGRRAVMGADQFAKCVARRANKHMGAYMMALGEADKNALVGAAKIHFADARASQLLSEVGTDASEALEAHATKKMFEDTFTDMGKAVKATTGLINQLPVLRGFVPFLRTPAALLKQGIAMTPLAPVTSTFRAGAFGADLIEQNVSIAKWAVGTMMFGWLQEQAAKGNLIGDGPQGAYKDVWEHHNHRNSFKLGDKYYGFNHLGPFSIILSLSADSAAMFNQTDDSPTQEKLQETIEGLFSEKAEDLPMFKSMFNIIHAMDSLKTNGDTHKVAEEFIGQEASEFVPAPFRIIRETEDPAIRRAQDAIGIIKQNLPGWSEHAADPVRDRFGHIQYPPVGSGPSNSATKMERLLNNLSPIPIRGDLDHDPVDKELYKYGVGFKPIPDHIDIGKGPQAVTVPLSSAQKTTWEKQAGHEFKMNGMNQHDYLDWLIKQPSYQSATHGQQKQRLEDTTSSFRHVTKPKLPPMIIEKSMQEMRSGSPPQVK